MRNSKKKFEARDSSIHCYADDSRVDSVYTGRAGLYRKNVDECQKKLVSSVEASLRKVSSWGESSLVPLNYWKTQVCALTTKKTLNSKLVSKKFIVIGRARRYFTPKYRLALYKAHMEYCFHLCAGAPEYQIKTLDCIQRRAFRIVGEPLICDGLDTLALRRNVSSLCVLYRIYYGEISGELFDLIS